MMIKIFDIIASVLTVTSLYLAGKYNKAWILYCISCIFFVIVCYHKQLWGLTGMGIILFGIGIKNYVTGLKK